MSYVIRVEGFANGSPCPIAGCYVKDFDFEAHDGLGEGEFTGDVGEAKHFATVGRALRYWQTQSVRRPLRGDGKPNRPLTCTTVSVVPLADFPSTNAREGSDDG